MENNKDYTISYANMRKIIKSYYSRQGKEVNVCIRNEIDTDRFAGRVFSSVEVSEKVRIAGVEATAKKYLSDDELKEIINSTLDDDTIEVVSLTDNVAVSSSIKGYLMDEHVEQTIVGKSFTITLGQKKNSLGSK